MSLETVYLRPSADVSLGHSTSSGSTGYNLLNETTCDEDSTYIYKSASSSSSSSSSTFTLTGTVPTNYYQANSIEVVVYAKCSSSSKGTLAITVGSNSSSYTMSTSYAAYSFSLSSSDITISGNTFSCNVTIQLTLSGSSKNSVTGYISQLYIELEADIVSTFYSITTKANGSGTITSSFQAPEGHDNTIKIVPSSGITIKKFTDNKTNVISSLVYDDGTAPAAPTVTSVTGASYGFSQSGNYYVSSNNGVSKSAALCQINITCEATATLTLGVINYAEETYDYGIIGAVDQSLSKTYTKDSNTTWDGSSSSSNTSSEQTVTVSIPSGTHFVQIKYRKDSATSENNDNFQFRIISCTYDTPIQSCYKYTLTNISTTHNLIVNFSDYIDLGFYKKINGSYVKIEKVFQKQDGAWVELTIQPNITNNSYILSQGE